jgi:hypothetical protein
MAKHCTQQPEAPVLSGNIQQTESVWREARSVSNEYSLGTCKRAPSQIRDFYLMLIPFQYLETYYCLQSLCTLEDETGSYSTLNYHPYKMTFIIQVENENLKIYIQ